MEKLTEAGVKESLEAVPEWSEIGGEISRTYQFDDFLGSIAFVRKVADYAEQHQHHPDILIRYNKVTLTVSTHDAGGITAKDFALAEAADSFAAEGG
ncbi:MAG TPA: 4a-hydroxytetrahydrobiopterin dehydratase [Phycisphaerales bacterium]|nr:4a-hydroxytetrahydrobiopterin dehydratase [Phycisphaerales bacterium]